MERLLIDTTIPDSSLNKEIEEFFLRLGCSKAMDAVIPVCSLPEHGGMILSMRDLASPDAKLPEKILLLHLDRRSLQKDLIAIVPMDDPSLNDRKTTFQLACFGYPMPQCTVAIVDPESKALCPPGILKLSI